MFYLLVVFDFWAMKRTTFIKLSVGPSYILFSYFIISTQTNHAIAQPVENFPQARLALKTHATVRENRS